MCVTIEYSIYLEKQLDSVAPHSLHYTFSEVCLAFGHCCVF